VRLGSGGDFLPADRLATEPLAVDLNLVTDRQGRVGAVLGQDWLQQVPELTCVGVGVVEHELANRAFVHICDAGPLHGGLGRRSEGLPNHRDGACVCVEHCSPFWRALLAFP
jgi:hypothetical protein